MDAHQTPWDDWPAEQWLEEALRFEKMAHRFVHHSHLNASFGALARDARRRAGPRLPPAIEESRAPCSRAANSAAPNGHMKDLDYFRRRAAEEQTAAVGSRDLRVRRVHREMAERYAGRIRAAASPDEIALRLVS